MCLTCVELRQHVRCGSAWQHGIMDHWWRQICRDLPKQICGGLVSSTPTKGPSGVLLLDHPSRWIPLRKKPMAQPSLEDVMDVMAPDLVNTVANTSYLECLSIVTVLNGTLSNQTVIGGIVNHRGFGSPLRTCVCRCFKHWIRMRSDGRRDSDVFSVTSWSVKGPKP